jgi:DNA protecting protein DprA
VVSRRTHRWERAGENFPVRDADLLDATVDAGIPRVLLGEGDRLDAFDAPRVAIVGTRAATPMGIADAREIAAFCGRAGLTVVSGLAIGIDAAAHEGALDAGGCTVGVVATGLDIVYPRRHQRLYARVREQGLIVGENEYGTQPLPWRFPIRNRIIAALADVRLGRCVEPRVVSPARRYVGVTAFEAALCGPVPTTFRAATLNV